jgi:hypothetical protein
MAVFAPRPRYQRFDAGEQIRLGLETPFRLDRAFGENFVQGVVDSFGLGTAIQEFSTPPLQDPNPVPFRGETPENYEARKKRNAAAAMSEDEYKSSPFFREALAWEPGMTEDRAAAIAKSIDTRAVRAHFSEKQPIAAFLGGFVGQALDPVNYVPVFGPLARTAAIARYGSIGGRALLGASEAAINTAAFGMLTADIRESLGNDASFATIASEIAMSALIGGAFGTAGGLFAVRQDARLRIAEAKARDAMKSVEMQQKAAVAANSAIGSYLETGDVRLDPTAMQAKRDADTSLLERTSAPRALAQETANVSGRTAGQVVVTPTGRRVAVEPQVVELSTLVHAEGALQVRNRRNASSFSQIEEMATTLDPARLMPNISADQGAPLVGEDNIVDSGNGRTMALRRVYENYPEKAAEYRQALVDAGYGDAATMQQPVLIQRRLTRLSADARAQFNAEANSSATARMSAVEVAQMDRAALTPEVLDLLDAAPVTAKSNRAFVQRFLNELPSNEVPALVNGTARELSADGVRRLENAVLAAAYGDVDAGVVRRFAEATDDNTRAIVGAMSDVAGAWARFRRDARTGVIAPHLDVTVELTEALRRIGDWREQAAREKRPVGKVIQEGMAQLDLLSGEISPVAQTFIRMFYRTDEFTQATGRDSLAATLSDIVESGYELGRPSLFGDALPDVPAIKVLENAIRRNVSADLLATGDALSRAEEISAAAEEPPAGAAGAADRPGLAEGEQAPYLAGPDGEPLVVYHGTLEAFDNFKRRPSDIGIHFGTLGQATDRLAFKAWQGKVGDERLVPANIALRNPLRLDDLITWSAGRLEAAIEAALPDVAVPELRSPKQARLFLQSLGYDGIVYRNMGEVEGAEPLRQLAQSLDPNADLDAWRAADTAYREHRLSKAADSFIVFEPEQIKTLAEPEQAAYTAAENYVYEQDVLAPSVGFRQEDPLAETILRDAAGRPITVYHGTNIPFDRFEYTEDIGFHFGTLETARTRLDQIGWDGIVDDDRLIMSVNLLMKNPLRLPDLLTWKPSAVLNALRDAGVITQEVADEFDGEVDIDFVREALDAAGYDGIVYQNATEGGGDSYIALDADRVRLLSVTDETLGPVLLGEDGDPVDLRGFSEEEMQLAFDLSQPMPRVEPEASGKPDAPAGPETRVLGRQELKRLREVRAFRELQTRNGVRSPLAGGTPPMPVTPLDNPSQRSTVRDVDGMVLKFEDEYQAEFFDLGDYLLALNDVDARAAAAQDFPRSIRLGPAQREVSRLWNVMAGHLVRDVSTPMRNVGDFARAAMSFAGQGRDELATKKAIGRTELELGDIIDPEFRQQWDTFTREELRTRVDLLSRAAPASLDTPPAPDMPPDGIAEAAGRVGTAVEPSNFGEQYGLDKEGGFAEEADLEALIAEGRMLPAEQEALAAADQLYADAEAYGKTLEVAAWCVR